MAKDAEGLFEMIRRVRPRDVEFYSPVCRPAEEPIETMREDAPPGHAEEIRRTPDTRGGVLQLPLFPNTV